MRSSEQKSSKSKSNRKGVVTLGGKAENATEKDLATKFANDVNGVKRVEIRMTIELSESKTKVTVVSLPARRVMK